MVHSVVPSRQPQRRTQTQRNQQTQEKLVGAAIDLLKKGRYVGLRTMDVAEHAGLSKGASTHHFPTKNALVLRALQEVYRSTQERALQRIAGAGASTRAVLEALMDDSKAFFLSDDFLLSLDLVMIDPESELGTGVKELARAYRLPVEQAWLEALLRAGHGVQEAEEVVRLTFAIARGCGIRQLIAGPEAATDRLMDSWLRMAEGKLESGTVCGPALTRTQET